MNKPLPRSAFGKKFAENFEKIFGSNRTQEELQSAGEQIYDGFQLLGASLKAQIADEDETWKQKVTEIAKGKGHDCKPALLADHSNWCCSLIADIMGYLYAERNWKRLKKTCWGVFIREINNPSPDLFLRHQAREQILDRMR